MKDIIPTYIITVDCILRKICHNNRFFGAKSLDSTLGPFLVLEKYFVLNEANKQKLNYRVWFVMTSPKYYYFFYFFSIFQVLLFCESRTIGHHRRKEIEILNYRSVRAPFLVLVEELSKVAIMEAKLCFIFLCFVSRFIMDIMGRVQERADRKKIIQKTTLQYTIAASNNSQINSYTPT